MLLVYDKIGETAAYYLDQMIKKDSSLGITIVKFDEKHWNDNRYTNEGEISDHALFIGNIKSVEPIKKIATIQFEKYGIIYSVSGTNAVLTANPKELLKSQEEYEKFLKDLDIIAPNRIDNCNHGNKKIIKVFFNGLRELRKERRSVIEQQLLYGAAIFFNNSLKKFIGEISDD